MTTQRHNTRSIGHRLEELEPVAVVSCHDTSDQSKINAVRTAVELGDEHLTVHVDADEPFATTLRRAVLLAGGRLQTGGQ